MYKQENKAGFKQYLFVIVMVIAVVFISEFVGWIVNYPLAGDILMIALCVLLVIIVYNHYASVFYYKITSKHIVIEKKSGRKVTEYDIPIEEINKIYIRKSIPKLKGKKLRLCSSVFGYKKTTVMLCGEENTIVVFEPDDKFVKKIKEYMND